MTVMGITHSSVGDAPVRVVLMRGSGQPPVSTCLVLMVLTACRDGKPGGFLGPCVPPMAVLVLSQPKEDGGGEAVPCSPFPKPAFLLCHQHLWFLLGYLLWWRFTSSLVSCWSRMREEKVEPQSWPKLLSRFPVSQFSFSHCHGRLLVSLTTFALDLSEPSYKVCSYQLIACF